MKTKSLLYAALICSLGISFSYANSPFSERDARNNVAVAASPRAREAFPWLTRAPSQKSEALVAKPELKNVAFAKSPRVLEQNPELTRSGSLPASDCSHVAALAHRGYAASPRVKEMYPQLRIDPANGPSCATCLAACTCCG